MKYQMCVTFNSTFLHFIFRDSDLLSKGHEIELQDSQVKPHQGLYLITRLLVTLEMKIDINTVINMDELGCALVNAGSWLWGR